MKKVPTRNILLWIYLNICVVVLMDLAMFQQTTPEMENASFLKKLMWSEFWATLQMMFVIPVNRLGNAFFTAPQLSLSSYVFNFIGQIMTNLFWLKKPVFIDDYASMFIILGAMYVSAYKLLG